VKNLGWDDNSINIDEVAERLQDSVTSIHARTRAQMYKGQLDWSHIAREKQSKNYDANFGNGDIDSEKSITI
jgi:tRNA-dihydrouridine synthase